MVANLMIILFVGQDDDAWRSLHTDKRFEVVVATTIIEAVGFMQGGLNFEGMVVTDGLVGDPMALVNGSDEIRDHLTFVTVVKPFFDGPIVAVGRDIGIDEALMSAGCTHGVHQAQEIPELLASIITQQRAERDRLPPLTL